jgi:hypothetical protein
MILAFGKVYQATELAVFNNDPGILDPCQMIKIDPHVYKSCNFW